MFTAFLKSLIICTAVILTPIVVLVLIGLGITSVKLIGIMLAIILPFLIIGLVNGYLAGLEAE